MKCIAVKFNKYNPYCLLEENSNPGFFYSVEAAAVYF